MQIIRTVLFLTAVFTIAVQAETVADPLLRAARRGDAQSQLKVGDQFFFGRNRPVRPGLAFYWFRRAADQGVPQAQYNVGMCLLHGWGVPKQPAAARMYLERSAAQKYPPAQLEFAKLLLSGTPAEESRFGRFAPHPPDREKALALLRSIAFRYVPAALELAKLLKEEQPVTQEITEERLRLLTFAAQGKDAPGAADLALAELLYERGRGKEAFRFLERGAAKGFPEAEAELAAALQLGRGCKTDPVRAVKLLQKAAAKENPRALVLLGEVKLLGLYLPHDPVGAAECFRKAAKVRYPAGLRRYGLALLEGIGVPRDRNRGMELLRQAAQGKDAEACYRLGVCYRDDGKDPAAAFFWFNRGAQLGHAGALRELGLQLFHGAGVQQDPARGLQMLRFAAEKGDESAQAVLNEVPRQ